MRPRSRGRAATDYSGDTERAMSQQNVETVRLMWEAFLGDDPVNALSFYDPDVEWDGTNLPDGKVMRGLEAVVEHTMRWAQMWDDWTIQAEQFIDAGGDQVVVLIHETGRNERGLHMDERHGELYTVRNGKIVRRRGFSRPDEALEAAGLPG
jgi:ketosteroid isomerase-like protein